MVLDLEIEEGSGITFRDVLSDPSIVEGPKIHSGEYTHGKVSPDPSDPCYDVWMYVDEEGEKTRFEMKLREVDGFGRILGRYGVRDDINGDYEVLVEGDEDGIDRIYARMSDEKGEMEVAVNSAFTEALERFGISELWTSSFEGFNMEYAIYNPWGGYLED